jgi:single-strand DNA-binding protein
MAHEGDFMNGVNRVFLLGYLGADPEMKTSRRGKPYTRLNLATHQTYRDEDGARQSTTQWHKVMVWGKDAERCKTYLSKGAALAIEGALTHFKAEPDDGPSFTQTNVTAHRVHFVGSRKTQEPSGFEPSFDEPRP